MSSVSIVEPLQWARPGLHLVHPEACTKPTLVLEQINQVSHVLTHSDLHKHRAQHTHHSNKCNRKKPFQFLFAYSLDYPVLLAEGTAIILFHPQGHAAIVEGMIAFSPNHWKRRKNMFQSHSAVQSTPTATFKLSLSNIYNHWEL